MGWSGGTDIARAVIESVMPLVKSAKTRAAIYRPIIRELEINDWDTQDEALGIDPAWDVAFKKENPSWGESCDEEGDHSDDDNQEEPQY